MDHDHARNPALTPDCAAFQMPVWKGVGGAEYALIMTSNCMVLSNKAEIHANRTRTILQDA